MSPTRCWFRSLSCLQRTSVLDLPIPGSFFPSFCMHTLSISPTFHSNARRTEFSHPKPRSMSKKNETSKDRTGRLSSLEQTAMWKQEDLPEEKPSRLAIPELPKRSKGQMAWSLVNTISGLSNAKDEVYGAMDTWCAWELEFPIVAVKQALRILKEKQEWLRIIQVTKWMFSKGHGHTMGSYQLLIQALDQTGRLEEAEDIWNMFVMKKAESVPRMMFGHMIKIYDQHEMFQKAILVFKSMEEMAIYPDDGTVVKMGQIYEKIGFPERKDELLEKYGKTWKYVYSKRTRAMVPVKRRNIDKEKMVNAAKTGDLLLESN